MQKSHNFINYKYWKFAIKLRCKLQFAVSLQQSTEWLESSHPALSHSVDERCA